MTLPALLCVEIKHLHGDEFAHWTDPESFATSWRNQRKRREWEVFHALRAGDAAPEGVLEVTAPDGTHVVDHVTGTVLPRDAPRLAGQPRASVTQGTRPFGSSPVGARVRWR